LAKVKYARSRFPWPGEVTKLFLHDLLFTKFIHWKYEDEWRAWVSLDEKEEERGEY